MDSPSREGWRLTRAEQCKPSSGTGPHAAGQGGQGHLWRTHHTSPSSLQIRKLGPRGGCTCPVTLEGRVPRQGLCLGCAATRSPLDQTWGPAFTVLTVARGGVADLSLTRTVSHCHKASTPGLHRPTVAGQDLESGSGSLVGRMGSNWLVASTPSISGLPLRASSGVLPATAGLQGQGMQSAVGSRQLLCAPRPSPSPYTLTAPPLCVASGLSLSSHSFPRAQAPLLL